MLSRRSFFGGLAAAIAAPAIVKASSLMPIKAVKVLPDDEWLKLMQARMATAYKATMEAMVRNLYTGEPTGVKVWWDDEKCEPQFSVISYSVITADPSIVSISQPSQVELYGRNYATYSRSVLVQPRSS